MPLRLLEITASDRHTARIRAAARADIVVDYHAEPVTEDGRRTHKLVLRRGDRQRLIDRLEDAIGRSGDYRIVVLPADAIIPAPPPAAGELERERQRQESTIREELYNRVLEGAALGGTFLPMVTFSAIVATFGLVAGNIAVVIGAMAIAPLLGPNLALAMAIAMGDRPLLAEGVKANATGVTLTVLLSAGIGYFSGDPLDSPEIMARTEVNLAGAAIALASGAAAALSLMGRQTGALVGVMVAVALMPPAAVFGLLAGTGKTALALGALTLLAVNVVCVLMSALIVFYITGVRPRGWYERNAASQSSWLSLLLFALLLAVLAGAIAARG